MKEEREIKIQGFTILDTQSNQYIQLGYSDEYTYFMKDKQRCEELIKENIDDAPNLIMVEATLTIEPNQLCPTLINGERR